LIITYDNDNRLSLMMIIIIYDNKLSYVFFSF